MMPFPNGGTPRKKDRKAKAPRPFDDGGTYLVQSEGTTFLQSEGTTFLQSEGTTFLQSEGTTLFEDDDSWNDSSGVGPLMPGGG